MKTQTVSYLIENAAVLPVNDEPLQISHNGVPVYRVYSEKQAKMQEEAIALLKLANLAERDVRNNQVMTLEQALKSIRSFGP